MLSDIRVALRGFRRTPSFPIAVVLIPTLGIGVAAATFTVCKTVLLDRLPLADQDRVVSTTDNGSTYISADSIVRGARSTS